MRALAALVAVLALLGCGQRDRDPCGRAFDRLARIAESRHQRPLSGEFAAQALQACRLGGTARYDPALGCAMSSPTDAVAAACLDRFLHDVVPPPAPGEQRPAEAGQGLNPLLGP